MEANRTARSALTLLVAFVAVTGVLVGPAVADDHDDGEVTVGDDETGLGVDGNDTSVSVHLDGDGVTVGDDGVDADTDDVEPADQGDNPVDGGEEEVEGINVRIPDNPADAPDSPYNYSELTPFYLIPGERTFCQTPSTDPPGDRDDLPDNVSDRMPENPTPVYPFDPPGPPATRCTWSTRTVPPFDPSDAPDDPEGGVKTYNFDVENDSIAYSRRGDLRSSDGWPGGRIILSGSAGTEGAKVVVMTNTDDGTKDYDVTTRADHEFGTQNGSAGADATAFGKNGGISVVCENDTCTVTPEGLPVGEQEFGGDGEDESGPFPCEVPVGPGDAPEPPENPTPIDPQNPPGSAFGPCAFFNPNDPPVDPENPPDDPDASHNIYRNNVGEDGALLIGSGRVTLDDGNGPSARFLTGDAASNDSVSSFQYARVNDGEKDWVAMTDAQFAPQSPTRVGPDGARVVADGGTSLVIIGREAGARITCDGTYCALSNGNLLLPEQEFQTARERNESDSDSESASTTTDASTADADTSTSSSDGSSTVDDDGVSSVGAARSGQSFTIPERTAPGRLTLVPSTFRSGIPDAASVTGTLLELV